MPAAQLLALGEEVGRAQAHALFAQVLALLAQLKRDLVRVLVVLVDDLAQVAGVLDDLVRRLDGVGRHRAYREARDHGDDQHRQRPCAHQNAAHLLAHGARAHGRLGQGHD